MEGTDRMEIINGLDFQLQNSSVSLGKFDGVHRGHRFLLQEIQKNKSYIPTVFTFAMNTEIPKLYTQEEKNRVLEVCRRNPGQKNGRKAYLRWKGFSFWKRPWRRYSYIRTFPKKVWIRAGHSSKTI